MAKKRGADASSAVDRASSTMTRRALAQRVGAGGAAVAMAASLPAPHGADVDDLASFDAGWPALGAASEEVLPMVQRGSARMLEHWFGEPTVVEEEHLKRVLELSRVEGVEEFEWFPYGVPAQRIDGVFGSMLVAPETAPVVVSGLLEMSQAWRHLEIFPYGIPIVDLIEVAFGAQGAFAVAELPG